VTASEGNTPFGFDFAPDGTLVVSEAFGGNAGESAASSYTIGGVEPEVISSSVPSGQTAACWLLIAQGTFAYTTNTASNTISGYHLDSDGMIALFDDDGETAILGADNSPLDMALSSNHDFLYVLNGKSDVIMGFSIDADGGLDKMDDELPIAEASVGLAAR
jgi:DNA-binding beta-propeller fold protein YncE